MHIVNSGNLEFGEIKSFAQHIDTDRYPALTRAQRGKASVGITQLGMDEHRIEIARCSLVEGKDGIGAIDIRAAAPHRRPCS